jgi:signal transduction histidine kinase
MKRISIYCLVKMVCVWGISLWLLACNQPRLPIGSKAAADSLLQPKGNLYESGRLTEALEFVDSAFHSRIEHTVQEWLAYYGTHAYVNSVHGDQYGQLKYLDSAINLLLQYRDYPELTDELSTFLMSRGDANFNLKKYAASYQDFFEAIRLAREHPDICRKQNVPYTIAMILYRQQQFSSSASYFIECLQYVDSCEQNISYRNNKKQEVLDNIGLCYTKIKKYDSAMLYYQQALKIVENNKYNLAVDSLNSYGRYAAATGVISGNMAKVFLGTGRVDSAIAYYRRAIALNAGPGHDLHDMQLCMIQLSEIYLSQGDLNQLRETLVSLGGSLDTVPGIDIRTEYERLMYTYHDKNNEPATALKYLTSYLHNKDSTAEQQKQMLQTDIGKELKDKQQQFEIALLQKDNQLSKTYLWVLVGFSGLIIIILALFYSMYRSSKKNVQRLTELNTEISGRRQALEQALEQLEATNLEKDRILRVVAHDLRNPIGGIVTLSNMMLEEGGDMVNERSKPFLEAISSASVSSIGLIQELLHHGPTGAADAEKAMTDIGGLLEHIVRLVQFKAAEKGQQIELQLPEKPLVVMIHPGQLERVVNNLLINAIKFSPRNTAILLSLQASGKGLQVAVHDQGMGIAPGNVPRIFDRSTSLKRVGTAGEKSFGLGLSICRQIVEAMGGRIWAESEEGKGSVFYVYLPVQD